jgi:hypothetical protein
MIYTNCKIVVVALLETTLLYSFIAESEEDFICRFWKGLNHNIQEIIMHEELYYVEQLFRISCKAEQKIRILVTTIKKSNVESPLLM